jgi:hypothetical protein
MNNYNYYTTTAITLSNTVVDIKNSLTSVGGFFLYWNVGEV